MWQNELCKLIFSSGVMLIILMAFFGTHKYKKAERGKVDKGKHKLWIAYGLAMFLVDKPLKGVYMRSKRSLENNFKCLYVKDKVSEENYMYIVSKVALVIFIVFATAVVSVVISVSYSMDNRNVTHISRNDFNGGEATYNLEVDSGEKSEFIEIYVSPKEYTDEELTDLLEGYKDELLLELLAENKSQNTITKPLNLVSTIGREKIPVMWEISNDEVIQVDGSLGENIDVKGTDVEIKATLFVRDIYVTHSIELRVYPPDSRSDIQVQVQEIVDSYDGSRKEIPLPESIGSKRLSYSRAEDNMAGYFFLLGVIAAVVIFIYKDKDIEKQMKKRESQMMIDYPEVVSKIMLLNKAGMSMRKAWEITLISSGNKKEHYVYREMKMTLGKINSGVAEQVAYEQFGKRCGLHCYIRFSNIIVQNLKRGTSDLCRALENEMSSALQERKNSALKQGEQAGTKLLGPMVIMLIIGLGFIVIPAFMSVQI